MYLHMVIKRIQASNKNILKDVGMAMPKSNETLQA